MVDFMAASSDGRQRAASGPVVGHIVCSVAESRSHLARDRHIWSSESLPPGIRSTLPIWRCLVAVTMVSGLFISPLPRSVGLMLEVKSVDKDESFFMKSKGNLDIEMEENITV